jgi:hypothetical protein
MDHVHIFSLIEEEQTALTEFIDCIPVASNFSTSFPAFFDDGGNARDAKKVGANSMTE